ncbi:hypothetical protein BC830DRAFT_1114770 [Chytriomyces sp. MP71]|nr:hypothetical protein BC830DRAFT_1114770 [Chytriomyces sp. MP71]
MAHAIVELLKMHNVESLVLVAALNLADQAGNDPVLYASMHAKNSAILKGKPALNASTPLNDPFLGALVPLLNLTPSIQTILIAAPAKRERTIETGVLLPGVSESDVDTALPFLATALSEMTGIAFSGDVARNVLLPHIQAVRDVEGTAKVADKKDDLLLMYM